MKYRELLDTSSISACFLTLNPLCPLSTSCLKSILDRLSCRHLRKNHVPLSIVRSWCAVALFPSLSHLSQTLRSQKPLCCSQIICSASGLVWGEYYCAPQSHRTTCDFVRAYRAKEASQCAPAYSPESILP